MQESSHIIVQAGPQIAGRSQRVAVMVVDDSAFMRKSISDILGQDSAIEVVGTARDGQDALNKLPKLLPRVITLDIEMPVLDGLGVLEHLRQSDSASGVSVVMLSSLTQRGAEATIRCLELGAFDFVGKPSGAISLDISKVAGELTSKVKEAAQSRPIAALAHTGRLGPSSSGGKPEAGEGERATERSTSAAAHGTESARAPQSTGGSNVIVIGASTGGPRALAEVVSRLEPPATQVPIVIVQHMPSLFTASLASRLNTLAPHGLSVREARDGDVLRAGEALVAPGGRHLVFESNGRAKLTDEPPVHGVRPSVDVTMSSLASAGSRIVVGVLLTGMGRDGARAMKMVRDLGGHTVVEAESTCVVYGMPRAALELGGAERVEPLGEIAASLSTMLR